MLENIKRLYRIFISRFYIKRNKFYLMLDNETIAELYTSKIREEKGKKYVSIWGVSVNEHYRRMGFATKLFKKSLSKLKKLVDFVVLETSVDNIAAINLYKSLGFIETKRNSTLVYFRLTFR